MLGNAFRVNAGRCILNVECPGSMLKGVEPNKANCIHAVWLKPAVLQFN